MASEIVASRSCPECPWKLEITNDDMRAAGVDPALADGYADHAKQDHDIWHVGQRKLAEALADQARQIQTGIGRDKIAIDIVSISFQHKKTVSEVIEKYREALRLLMGGEDAGA